MNPPTSSCGVYGTVSLQYEAGVAAATLSFGVRLRAGAFGAQPLNQIEVQYYLSEEETSGWTSTVDSFTLHNPDQDVTSTSEISVLPLAPKLSAFVGCQTHFIRIRNTSSALLVPGTGNTDSYAELHVTLTPKDLAPPNQVYTDDYSYQPDSTTFQDNLQMAVFVCGDLVDGCTPGDSGTCQ